MLCLFIFRCDWHYNKFFQLSGSHLYFILYLQKCQWEIFEFFGIFYFLFFGGGWAHYAALSSRFDERVAGLFFKSFFLFLFDRKLLWLLYNSCYTYLNLTLPLEVKDRMEGIRSHYFRLIAQLLAWPENARDSAFFCTGDVKYVVLFKLKYILLLGSVKRIDLYVTFLLYYYIF